MRYSTMRFVYLNIVLGSSENQLAILFPNINQPPNVGSLFEINLGPIHGTFSHLFSFYAQSRPNLPLES